MNSGSRKWKNVVEGLLHTLSHIDSSGNQRFDQQVPWHCKIFIILHLGSLSAVPNLRPRVTHQKNLISSSIGSMQVSRHDIIFIILLRILEPVSGPYIIVNDNDRAQCQIVHYRFTGVSSYYFRLRLSMWNYVNVYMLRNVRYWSWLERCPPKITRLTHSDLISRSKKLRGLSFFRQLFNINHS